MKVITELNKDSWNQFILRERASFLQSWEWGEAQKTQGRKVLRVAAEENGEIVFAAQIIRHDLPFGFSYSYVPFGPVIAENVLTDEKIMREAAREFAKEAKKILGGLFLFLEPDWAGGGGEERALAPVFRDAGFRASLKHIQPDRTLLIDLRQSEDAMLAQMEKSARYNIGYAERAGVVIRELPPTRETAQSLFHFLQTRAEAKDFFVHPLKHYEALAEIFGGSADGSGFARARHAGGGIRFFGAYHNNECIGMNAIVFFGKTATNLLSGVSREYRNLKAANLLRWHAMRDAKQAGCEAFDQWGVSEKFPGVSAFKRGFGGKEIRRTESLHLPFSVLLYFAYRLLRG
jgi:peptidoglycan pentaglycine glycine transferase (the first glycine)